jgi:hypothetical protein
MDYRPIINCLVMVLFTVAAGINLWDIMLSDAPRKRIILDAVIGLVVLILWATSESDYLLR